MAYKMKFKGNGNVNIWRVVMKVIITLVALWGGGIAMTSIGTSITNTTSPFYQGLSIIGYTVGANPTNGSDWCSTCATGCAYDGGTVAVGSNCITSTSGTGILAIVGIFAMISIISEFVNVAKY